jgi:hypothetical protein
MSSVNYFITCPHCTSEECNEDFDNGETFILCYACGYYQHSINNTVVKEITDSYGAVHLLFKEEVAHTYAYVESEEHYNALYKELSDVGFDKLSIASLSRVVDGKRIITNLLAG